ncbi:MAG: ribonuclease P protein subunit [Thermoplasmata archaeon]
MLSDYLDEFIGRSVTITWSTNITMIGKTGLVIDETKNTFVIAKDKKTCIIPKRIAKFKFANQDNPLDGRLLTMVPEDRIKNWNRTERKIKRLR